MEGDKLGMSDYFLRIEAVNIGSTIYDTSNLNIIRGASVLLRNAITSFASDSDGRIENISTGASIGLFRFEADDDTAAQILKNKAIEHFSSDKNEHLTFVIDVVSQSNDYAQTRESLLSLNRWQQFQKPTLSIPLFNEDISTEENNQQTAVSPKPKSVACSIERKRPIDHTLGSTNIQGEKLLLSTSTFAKYNTGAEEKHEFYIKELEKYDPDTSKLLQDVQFSHDLKQLSYLSAEQQQGNSNSLNGKIAVIHVDGNKFSETQRRLINQEKNKTEQSKLEAHKKWDESMGRKRAKFLGNVLNNIIVSGDSSWRNPDEGNRIRLETLMWGGDEFTFVVPAWKGWEFISLLSKEFNDWKYEGETLTHAVSIVFAHSNAPILRIIDLAEALVKKVVKSEKDGQKYEKHNRLAYEILESFDYVGNDILKHRNSRVKDHQVSEELLLELRNFRWVDFSNSFSKLKTVVPKRQLHKYVFLLSRESINAGQAEKMLLDNALHEYLDESDRIFLQGYLGKDHVFWIHVLDLWDYVDAPNSPLGGSSL